MKKIRHEEISAYCEKYNCTANTAVKALEAQLCIEKCDDCDCEEQDKKKKTTKKSK